jgi:hypothetical protein
MFKRTAALVFAVALSGTSVQAQSASQPVIVKSQGLAPLSGGELPSSCAAEQAARTTSKQPHTARVTGGYAAGICEAEDMARQLMAEEIGRIAVNGSTIGDFARQDKQVEQAVATFARAARTIERKLWLDRQLAEVTMQVELGSDFLTLLNRVALLNR